MLLNKSTWMFTKVSIDSENYEDEKFSRKPKRQVLKYLQGKSMLYCLIADSKHKIQKAKF